MSKYSFLFEGRGETFIQSRVLKKSKKGSYKNDIIELSALSKTDDFVKRMTPFEAEILIVALSVALLDYDNKKRRIKK